MTNAQDRAIQLRWVQTEEEQLWGSHFRRIVLRHATMDVMNRVQDTVELPLVAPLVRFIRWPLLIEKRRW